jgi:hypothetical protein
LLAKAIGMFQVETVHVHPPEHSQVGGGGPGRATTAPATWGRGSAAAGAPPRPAPASGALSARCADCPSADGAGAWHARRSRRAPARDRTARDPPGAPRWASTRSARRRERPSPRAAVGAPWPSGQSGGSA